LRIGLLSDTHGFLDPAVFSYFKQCDEIWHAGDFGPLEVLDQLESFKPVRGVWGNIDGTAVRVSVPRDLTWECEGMTIFMTHSTGYPGHWNVRAKKLLKKAKANVAISGHSHILKVMRDEELGVLHLNPGAAGHQGFHTIRTMMRFQIDGGKLHDLEAIELGPRGSWPSTK
jgi:putative phosphoesterase